MGGFVPSTPGGTVSPTDQTVAGYGTGGESYDSSDSALAKQQKYYQAMSDFYAGQSTAGQNYADYYSKAKEVVGFDSKLKEYEKLKLDSGATAEMDDLNKRVASKRAEYLETDTGIYVGGQRVGASITNDGIYMGDARIPATITAGGIYATGNGVDSDGNPIPSTGGGTVNGSVNLVIPSGASIPVSVPANSSIGVDASALDTVLTKGVGVNAEALDTAMAKGIEINADPFAQFLIDNKINIDGTALQSAIEGNKIKIDSSALNGQTIPVSGSVTATGTVTASGEVSLSETSLTGINTLAENSTAKETRESELHANKKTMLQNQVNYKDINNAITDEEHKYKTQVIEDKDYAGQKAKAFTDLHSGDIKNWIDVQGNALSVPAGLMGMLAGALPQFLNEHLTRITGKNLADIDNAEQLKERIDNMVMEFLGLYSPSSDEIDETNLSDSDKLTVEEMKKIVTGGVYSEWEDGVV